MNAPLPTRRSQTERRENTRRALLEATLGCLTELGYGRTTTTEVVKRAGVSQGALFKHFPNKSALVAAATEQLFADLFTEFEAAFDAARDDREPIAAALRGLWDVFCRPELLAVYRLYVEAPADPELHAAVVPVVKRHGENLAAYAAGLFPTVAESPTHRTMVDAAVYAMQGLALQRAVLADTDAEARVLRLLEDLGRTLFPTPLDRPAALALTPDGGLDR